MEGFSVACQRVSNQPTHTGLRMGEQDLGANRSLKGSNEGFRVGTRYYLAFAPSMSTAAEVERPRWSFAHWRVDTQPTPTEGQTKVFSWCAPILRLLSPILALVCLGS